MRRLLPLGLAAALAACASAEPSPQYDWDAIGRDFCRAAVSRDLDALAPVVTPELGWLLGQAEGRVPPQYLFQGYDVEGASCTPRTRNAALIDIRRDVEGGTGWVDTLVVVPEADGSTRIDDILFGTRRSDTLRARLGALLGR
ncbi:MAG TPA: hypothetical protein VK022_01980 [Paracoccaceae bacterium]|nr:hypothetical protein [Paracoccaceae bacterium]